MWLVLWLALSARAEVIDRVVAVVEQGLVLDSEVRLEAQLATLDTPRSPFWAADRSTPEQRLVDAAVIRELSGTVALYDPPDKDVRDRLEALRAKFADAESWSAFLTRWGLDEEALRAVLRRRISVELFLRHNLDVRPDDRPAWDKACDDYLRLARARFRIRYVSDQP